MKNNVSRPTSISSIETRNICLGLRNKHQEGYPLHFSNKIDLLQLIVMLAIYTCKYQVILSGRGLYKTSS